MHWLISIAMVILCTFAQAENSILIMGYPEREKEPYIAESPNNAGIYNDLFSRAAKRIGFTLRIVRPPKKRLFDAMRRGEVDFYPGSFEKERIPIITWAEYGIATKEICLSRIDMPLLNSLKNTPPLHVITELGSSKESINQIYPNLHAEILGGRVDIPIAIDALQGRRGDLFITEENSLRYYLERKNIDLTKLGLRLHENCIPQVSRLLIGLSRRSEKYAEMSNPNFKPKEAFTMSNLPQLISPTSTLGKFIKALIDLKNSGETHKIIELFLRRKKVS